MKTAPALAPPARPARRAWAPGLLLALAVLTGAWAWWTIAWPVAVLAEPAKHAGHFGLVYVHVLGGTVMLALGAANLYVGWTRRAFRFHRFLAQGWTVVSVEYRRAEEALAPAAVADVRCALRWAAVHAAELKADPHRLVVGLLLSRADLDRLLDEAEAAARAA